MKKLLTKSICILLLAISTTIYGQTVTTLAGSGVVGSANDTVIAAQFNRPTGLTVDDSGNIYVADYGNSMIRKINAKGVVSTLAGNTTPGYANGKGSAAQFYDPANVAVDDSGNVYVADAYNDRIRKITPAGVVTSLAGYGAEGYADGTGTAAQFYFPYGIAIDDSGNLYVGDVGNDMIRKVTPKGVVTTLAGNLTSGSANGTGTAARFNGPNGVAVDDSGNVYVADYANNMIRKVTAKGVVTTLAGNTTAGYTDATGTAAQFNGPGDVAVDDSGNVYVADAGNNRIRKISPKGVVTTFAGSGVQGSADETGTAAEFNTPAGVAVDTAGYVYVADDGNNKIRKISPSGVVTTLAGTGVAGSANDTVIVAQFNYPEGVAVDTAGNVYVADNGNNMIRKVSPSGVVKTLAGSTKRGYVDGIGVAAVFDGPTGVALDAVGNVVVADSGNGTMRKVTPAGVVTSLAAPSNIGPDGVAIDDSGNIYITDVWHSVVLIVSPSGVVSTLAGSKFLGSTGVAVDAAGNVYVADTYNNMISKITPSGVVTTLAGSTTSGYADGVGTAAQFNHPFGVAVDAAGNVYVADTYNNMIREISPTGVVTTLAGNITAGYVDGIGTAAQFNQPWGIAVDTAGNLYVGDSYNNMIRKITNIPPLITASQSGSSDIRVYPNPNNSGNKQIKILDITGNLRMKINSSVNTIDISSLDKGVYILEIVQDNQVYNQKLIRE